METTPTTALGSGVCESVLEAVAACHDTDPLSIEVPLGDVVDGDSLENLWTQSSSGPSDVGGVLSFDYYGCRVTVTSEGDVEASPRG